MIGIANIVTGLIYKLPMPIEPLKVLSVGAGEDRPRRYAELLVEECCRAYARERGLQEISSGKDGEPNAPRIYPRPERDTPEYR